MTDTFHKIIKEICDELNIEFKLLSKDWVIMLSKDSKTRFISGYKFDLNNHAIGQIFDDKYAMFEMLKEKDISVIEHNIVYGKNNKNSYASSCNSLEYLEKLFNKYNKDVVLKINNGTCGINVYHIKTMEELEEKFLKIAGKNNSLSLCPYLEIESEFRTIILNGEIKLIYKKERPLVIGDGTSSILELLQKFNYQYFKDIKDEKLNNVIEKDEEYLYDWKFNLSRGARMSEEVSKIEKDNITRLISELSRKINLGFCSVDIVKSKDKYYILEINSGVMMKNYINQAQNGYKIAYNIYKEAILEMFKN